MTGVTNGVPPGTATLTYYAGPSATGSPLGGAPTDAGMYTVLASCAGSTDYASASNTATYSVARATPTISVTAPNAVVYDSLGHGATVDVTGVNGGAEPGAATRTYFAGPSATGTPLGGPPTEAGTYTVHGDYAGNTDYVPLTRDATYAIGQAALSVTVTPPVGAIYDGAAQGATVVVTGVDGGATPATPSITYFSGGSASGTSLAGAPTDAGTYTVEAIDTGNTDYQNADQTRLMRSPRRFHLWRSRSRSAPSTMPPRTVQRRQ